MWTSHEGFLELFKNVWDEEATGCVLVRLVIGLKKLKQALKEWNVATFSQVERELTNMEDQIINFEHEVADQFSQDAESKLLEAKAKHQVWLNREEVLWKQ
ncbi:hypothetical protein I3760_04G126400 [Carya illinoinensis]|uniref:Uncharacterized protein n=1 Tax=Carya illinoinensis TaxID=32201 RepID=A0A922JRI6_CARIL|nr:hypothetical protein I3760_04G126400 [Carya illinoinensis]KAG6717936.1 hypothetical protein I3842_04G126000 [Carya illinoinensis]